MEENEREIKKKEAKNWIKLNGIITCEESQAVTIEFRKLGHDFFSNDIQECSGGHPECTYLTNAGLRWIASKTERQGYDWSDKYEIFINWDRFNKMEQAALFFKSMLSIVKSVGCGYIENPVMRKYAMEIIGIQPTQIIQPWMFGHMETKATCLWLVGLPKLKETENVYKKNDGVTVC